MAKTSHLGGACGACRAGWPAQPRQYRTAMHSASRMIITTAAATAIVLGLSSCAGDSANSAPVEDSFTSTGTVSAPYHLSMTMSKTMIFEASELKQGGECAVDAYSDVQAGTQVVLRSSGGKILGSGDLQEPTLEGKRCQMEFKIPSVAVQSDDIYEISVGNGEAGSLVFNESELASGDASMVVN